MEIKDHIGNCDLLALPKTAFLCSRKVPAGVILKCYDWAIEQRSMGRCVISGFHSTIEKDVFHYLLKGTQPIIIALARSVGPRIKKDLAEHIQNGRLLIISPFEPKVKRADKQTAAIRNQMMIDHADNIVVGHVTSEGELEKLLSCTSKPIHFI